MNEDEFTFKIAIKIITEFIILLNAKKDFRLSVSYRIEGTINILITVTNINKKIFKNKRSENSPNNKFVKYKKIVK